MVQKTNAVVSVDKLYAKQEYLVPSAANIVSFAAP